VRLRRVAPEVLVRIDARRHGQPSAGIGVAPRALDS
jgi:hypothetical protein